MLLSHLTRVHFMETGAQYMNLISKLLHQFKVFVTYHLKSYHLPDFDPVSSASFSPEHVMTCPTCHKR